MVLTSSAKILRNFCEIRSSRRGTTLRDFGMTLKVAPFPLSLKNFGMTQVGALFAFSIGMLFAFWQKASFICGNAATSLGKAHIICQRRHHLRSRRNIITAKPYFIHRRWISLKTLRVFRVSLVLFMRPAKRILVDFAQMSVIFLSKMQELHKKIKKTFDFFFLI